MDQLTIVPGVQYAAAVVIGFLHLVPHQLGNRDSFGHVVYRNRVNRVIFQSHSIPILSSQSSNPRICLSKYFFHLVLVTGSLVDSMTGKC